MSTLIAFIRADPALDVPVVPGTWDLVPESNRWATVYPLGRSDGRFFCARLIARASGNPQRAVFVCVGSAGMLAALAARIAADGLPWTQTWATLGALRADGGATATAIKAQWIDERPSGAGTLVALWARMAGDDADDGET